MSNEKRRTEPVERTIDLPREFLGIIHSFKMNRASAVTKRHGEWVEVVVPIDADNVAYITMTEEAYAALRRI